MDTLYKLTSDDDEAAFEVALQDEILKAGDPVGKRYYLRKANTPEILTFVNELYEFNQAHRNAGGGLLLEYMLYVEVPADVAEITARDILFTGVKSSMAQRLNQLSHFKHAELIWRLPTFYEMAEPTMLTPAEIAVKTGTSESSWRNRAAAGKIPGAFKKGKQWLIPYEYSRAQKVLADIVNDL